MNALRISKTYLLQRNTTVRLIAVVFVLSLFAPHPVAGQLPPQAMKPPLIWVSDFGKENVGGLLQHPLGTVVRVTGVAVDGDTARKKADMGKTLLSIETVNGKKLLKPVVFEFLTAAKTIVAPQPGSKFDYYVHEYGAFDGVVEPPKELGIDYPKVANDGFHYRPFITVHKSMPVPAN